MANHERGLFDTSVIIGMNEIDGDMLPEASSIAALTLGELTSGPLSTNDPRERAERLERLQWVERTFEAIPFDVAAAHAYGRIYSACLHAKQKPRGARAVDLLIAATALSRGLPLYVQSSRFQKHRDVDGDRRHIVRAESYLSPITVSDLPRGGIGYLTDRRAQCALPAKDDRVVRYPPRERGGHAFGKRRRVFGAGVRTS